VWEHLQLLLAARGPPKTSSEPRRGRGIVFRNSRNSLSAGRRACEPAAKPAIPGVSLFGLNGLTAWRVAPGAAPTPTPRCPCIAISHFPDSPFFRGGGGRAGRGRSAIGNWQYCAFAAQSGPRGCSLPPPQASSRTALRSRAVACCSSTSCSLRLAIRRSSIFHLSG
jgi:hypothetical protein